MDTPTLRKTYKYKLKPTSAQAQALDMVLWRCRELYNAGLEERREAYRKRGVTVTEAMQSAQLPGIKEVRPEYKDIHSQVLQDVLHRLDLAYQAFFRRMKAGEKAGYPRFQGRNRFNSFTFKQFGNGATCDNGFLVLSKIGRIGVRWSRPLEGTPKTVTISHEADGWYACFSCAEVPTQSLPLTGRETGIDIGLEWYLTRSDGSTVENPRHLRKAEKHLKRCQRRVSRRKKGSKRRAKAVRLLKRAHQKVARQRLDFQHKTALMLVRLFDVIYHENLQVANLVKNHALAKSISDAGWAQFLSLLAFKAACAGKLTVAVNPAYTSQTCSGCGVLVAKGLSIRWHSCPDCGTSLHRDHNSAKVIEGLGQSLRGVSPLGGM
ncbi:MAG: RNA-guided endonuclease InsQ/TnpB family protein [bacterium]